MKIGFETLSTYFLKRFTHFLTIKHVLLFSLTISYSEIHTNLNKVCRVELLDIGYWWESQKVRDHWEDQDVGG
jgi:hypothetical protein